MKIRYVGSVLIALVIAAVTASGQAKPSGYSYSTLPRLEAGAEFSYFNTDVLKTPPPKEYGVGAWVDYRFLGKLGLEAEGRTVHFNQQVNIRQDTLSGGLRYTLLTNWLSNHKLTAYAKGLAGIASADFPPGTYSSNPHQGHNTLPAVTAGGGVSYRLNSHFSLRGEYEYEFWYGYGRGAVGGTGMVNPQGVNVGVAYRFF